MQALSIILLPRKKKARIIPQIIKKDKHSNLQSNLKSIYLIKDFLIISMLLVEEDLVESGKFNWKETGKYMLWSKCLKLCNYAVIIGS